MWLALMLPGVDQLAQSSLGKGSLSPCTSLAVAGLEVCSGLVY